MHRLRFLPRYGLVSLLCMLINNLLLIAFDLRGFHYSLCILLSVAIMTPLGFVLQGSLTFGATMNWSAFRRYALAVIGNLPLALALMWLIRDLAGAPMVVAAPFVTLVAFGLNFIASHWALAPAAFQPKRDRS
jgi:putative flippase GtrA